MVHWAVTRWVDDSPSGYPVRISHERIYFRSGKHSKKYLQENLIDTNSSKQRADGSRAQRSVQDLKESGQDRLIEKLV